MLLSAPAKINLLLDVLGKRGDGYHELHSVMLSISLCDTVELMVVPAKESLIRVCTDRSYLPADERNTAWKAAARYLAAVGQTAEVDIRLRKSIPVGAGLGGSSADAAAVLWGMDRLMGNGMDEREKIALAASVGADVPFMMQGGCAEANGIGEQLRALPVPAGLPIVISKPRPSASTKAIFTNLDALVDPFHPDAGKMLDAVQRNDWQGIGEAVGNTLESVTAALCPDVTRLKQMFEQCGALGTAMSGSGTAVFGIFASESAASAAVRNISRRYPQTWSVRPVPVGITEK